MEIKIKPQINTQILLSTFQKFCSDIRDKDEDIQVKNETSLYIL